MLKKVVMMIALVVMLTCVLPTRSEAMTRFDAVETLIQAGASGPDAVNIAWGLCDYLDHVDNVHLYNIAVYLAIQVVHDPQYNLTFHTLPVHDIAVSARLIYAYEESVRYQEGH